MSDHDTAQSNQSNASREQSSPSNKTSKPGAASAPGSKPQGNAAFRAMGLPNWRLRLPSRNWSIFLTIVGSFTGAIVYDRRQKKAVQKKWCTLVEHVAQEPLPASSLARRVTIILAAPPGDGIRVTREHFTEYVKPILVAGALDWDVIEGRREGEVRAGLAERIRKLRKSQGEESKEPTEPDVSSAIAEIRDRNGILDTDGPKGDIVIGRHTWREYIRGLHEGWLGPIDEPLAPAQESNSEQQIARPESVESSATDTAESEASTSESPAADSETPTLEAKPTDKVPDKPAKPSVTPPYNQVSSYSESSLPRSCPDEFQPSVPIASPHILGIRNTPIRMYRFLTRRHLADQIGRETAAAVLAVYRPFDHHAQTSDNMTENRSAQTEYHADDTQDSHPSSSLRWEQQNVLSKEESEWWKKARKRQDGEGERVWLDPIVLDPRIGERMRKFELTSSEEERALAIAKGAPGISMRAESDSDGGGIS